MKRERIDDVNYIRNVSGRRNKLKPYLLFLIRFAETFAANFIPSAIGINIVFRNPTPGAWEWTSAMVFLISAILNCTYWYKYVKSRNNFKDFYLMNGSIYVIYAFVSVAMLNSDKLGPVIFSTLFANLRVCEVFGLGTVMSVYLTNLFMLFVMVVCERISSFKVNKKLSEIAENGAENIEMVVVDESLLPTQSEKNVKFMSVAELQAHDELEIKADMEKVVSFYDVLPEEIWDRKMTKGHGDKIVYNTDVSEEEEIENSNINYSSSSLWEKDIYKGRTPENSPITQYKEALDGGFEKPEMGTEALPLADYDAENLWGNISKGKETDDINEWETTEHTSVNPNAAYDPDNLWDNIDKKRVRKSEEEPYMESIATVGKNPNADYDEENLWDNIDISRRRNEEEIHEQLHITPNEDYDPENLWGNISRGRATDEYNPDEEMQNVSINPNADYDSDSLWGNIVKGRGNTVATGEETNTEENEINPSADYEAEHLWGEIDSSRLKPDDYYDEQPIDETTINPNEEYDTDSMWRNISSERLKPDDYYTKNDYNEDDINPNADYDTDSLWRNISEERLRNNFNDSEEPGNINPEKDYSPEELWDKGLYKGKKKES